MAVKHNNSIPHNHFRKDWQRRVHCHFDQPGKKSSRRFARRTKAAALAPRPVDKLRPIVRCSTIKYNRRVRVGRGFSLEELKAAGIPAIYAATIGIAVDPRRQNLSEESLATNVERLKAYKARLIVFPRKSNRAKNGDALTEEQEAGITRNIKSAFTFAATPSGISEVAAADMPAGLEVGAYRALRVARSNARLQGVRAKREQDKAEAEAKK